MREAFEDFIHSNSGPYFTAAELIRLPNPRWDGERECVPPRDLWENILGTLELANEIRAAWGGPVVVYSGYRPSVYNRLIGGARNSQHMAFRALDLHPRYGLYRDFESLVGRLVEVDRRHNREVGFGRYPESKFVHIDVGYKTRDWEG